ncbi:hypothetical protein SO802_003834 [Lithocarpus litseifolius]|uniref:Uncharacterized protein n=1 Tax=Lithocarpus litseifolius TaxID=425828 RepID=A0AAW2E578_9ROSI
MAKKSKKRAIKQARDEGDSGSQSQVAPSSSESPTNEALVSSNSVINGGSEEYPKQQLNMLYELYKEAQFEIDDLVLEREEKSDRNKTNRKENQAVIATTSSVPMAKRKRELEEKNGCKPSPIECFKSMHMKKDGVTFASEKAQKLYGEIVNDSQIFFKVTGPPTHGRVLDIGAGVKPNDVYGPSSSSQCSKRCQVDRLKEKEDFELRFKEAEDKSSAEKMELQGEINQLK